MIHIVIENETVGGIQQDIQKLLEGVNTKTVKEVEGEPEKRPTTKGQAISADAAKVNAHAVKIPEAKPQTAPEGIAPELEGLVEEDTYDEPPTMEQTRAKLNELRQKKGPKAVREILTGHSVGSFTDLNPDEYAAVIAEVEAAL